MTAAVHLLASADGAKATLTARCGQTWPHRPQEPFPADLTAWASGVSCPACGAPPV